MPVSSARAGGLRASVKGGKIVETTVDGAKIRYTIVQGKLERLSAPPRSAESGSVPPPACWRSHAGSARLGQPAPDSDGGLPAAAFAYVAVSGRAGPAAPARARRVAIEAVRIPAPDGPGALATIVKPQTGCPCGGVLWVHWLADEGPSDRHEFENDALALARAGIVSVLPDAMWSVPGWYEHRAYADDFAHSLAQVIALRRALDVLSCSPASIPTASPTWATTSARCTGR